MANKYSVASAWITEFPRLTRKQQDTLAAAISCLLLDFEHSCRVYYDDNGRLTLELQNFGAMMRDAREGLTALEGK